MMMQENKTCTLKIGRYAEFPVRMRTTREKVFGK